MCPHDQTANQISPYPPVPQVAKTAIQTSSSAFELDPPLAKNQFQAVPGNDPYNQYCKWITQYEGTPLAGETPSSETITFWILKKKIKQLSWGGSRPPGTPRLKSLRSGMHRDNGLGMPKYNILIAGVTGLGAQIQTLFLMFRGCCIFRFCFMFIVWLKNKHVVHVLLFFGV